MMDPVQTALMAIEALRRDALLEAERLSHQAYRAAPSQPTVLHAYGAVMQARGSYREAVRAFRKLTALAPAEASHWMNLATSLRAAAELDEAFAAYQEAYRRGERSADFYYNAALLLMEKGEVEAARDHLREAARRAPRDAEIRYQHARVCYLCVDVDETLEALRDWSSWQGWTVDTLVAVGALLLQMGEQADAERILRQLESLPARSAELELRIAGMLERLNRVEEAEQRFADVARPADIGTPLYQRWLALRAQLAHRAGDLVLAEQSYRELLGRGLSPGEQQEFLFPLAKVLDAGRQYAEALTVIAAAHAAQWQSVQKLLSDRIDEQRPIMAITAYGCDPVDAAGWREERAPDVQNSPIFIVAFPRSGTTLLEQMLDAHPQLQTMDEQPFLQKAVLRFEQHGLEYPSQLQAASGAQLEEIREYYWQMVRRKLDLAPGQRLIDKNPLNMLRLPAIRRLFPESPILLAIRHPCDVVISNYFQHYRAPEFVRLCRDLPSLALAYRKAFDYWYEQAQILQPRVFEVRYESFVANFDRDARQIAAFLQLDWHEAMAKPAEHARAKGFISTPSYSQVVQPVNSKAVGRWRRYEAAMQPVVEELRGYLQRWNYEI